MSHLVTPLNKKHLLVFILALLTLPTVASAGLLENTLWTIVVNVFGSFAALGGLLLNYAIQNYVINGYEASLVSTINNLWVVMRDIFNLTFIFGLLYIGFKMILDSENSNTRRWLVSLILAALLINFSLYITKVVIDVSNIIATEIVTSGAFPIESGEINISGAFMNSLGIQSLFGYKPNPATGEAAYGLIFGSAVIFIVMGFVFAAGGVLLIIRFAVLALYMILSPLMFLGWVFPQLQGYTNKYWQGFLGRAFFAPIYLLLVYFSLIIIQNVFGTKLQDASYTDLFGQRGPNVLSSFQDTLPPFILACIFLIASLVIAQRLGAEGAGAAVSMGRNLSNRAKRVVMVGAGAATAGASARVLRNTAGRAANTLTQSSRFKKWAAGSYTGQQAFKAAQRTATSSFDARQAGGLGQALGVGTGVTGGYKKSVEDRKKADEQFLKDTHVKQDKNSPEYIAQVNKREAEIKENAAKELETIAKNKQLLDTMEQVTSTEIQGQIETFSKELKEAKNKSQEISASKTSTAKEKSDAAFAVTAKESEIAIAHIAKQKQEQKESINKEYAGRTLTPAQQAKKDEQLAAVDQEVEAVIESMDNKADELNAKISSATIARNQAAAEAEYANELTYIKRLESSQRFWKNMGAVSGAGAGGATIGSSAASLAGLGASAAVLGGSAGVLVGAAAAGAHADRIQQSIDSLREKYGVDGTPMARTKKQQEQFKNLAEAQKQLTETPEAPPTPPTPN